MYNNNEITKILLIKLIINKFFKKLLNVLSFTGEIFPKKLFTNNKNVLKIINIIFSIKTNLKKKKYKKDIE